LASTCQKSRLTKREGGRGRGLLLLLIWRGKSSILFSYLLFSKAVQWKNKNQKNEVYYSRGGRKVSFGAGTAVKRGEKNSNRCKFPARGGGKKRGLRVNSFSPKKRRWAGKRKARSPHNGEEGKRPALATLSHILAPRQASERLKNRGKGRKAKSNGLDLGKREGGREVRPAASPTISCAAYGKKTYQGGKKSGRVSVFLTYFLERGGERKRAWTRRSFVGRTRRGKKKKNIRGRGGKGW